jgi:hypothetical protein
MIMQLYSIAAIPCRFGKCFSIFTVMTGEGDAG